MFSVGDKHSVKLGGAEKIVEINGAKIRKWMYNWGHFYEGQWVFGGIDWGSANFCIVSIPNQSADTLLEVIYNWIHPGKP